MTILKHHIAVAGLVAGLVFHMAAFNGPAQTPPSLPPGVQDVVKLAHAGMSDDVILAHIKSTRATYTLSADEILYLSGQGVSQTVIQTLLSGNAAPAVAAPPAAPAVPAMNNPPPAPAYAPGPAPAAPIAPAYAPAPGSPAGVPTAPAVAASPGDFQTQLAPYGSWVQMPGYGLCWQPAVAMSDPLWRPYFDQGHWVYSETGWFWQSDYPWGGIVFHYGRWARAATGWVWVPGYDWASAWVCWRHAEGYCGWAPLPPTAVYRADLGLTFGGRLAVDVDFGLDAEAFVFVGYDRFWDRDLRPFRLPRERVGLIFRDSRIMNGYRLDHGRFIVEGMGHDRVAELTHHEIRVEPLGHDSRSMGHAEPGRRDSHDERHDHH